MTIFFTSFDSLGAYPGILMDSRRAGSSFFSGIAEGVSFISSFLTPREAFYFCYSS
jgi:hypothetical protein